MAERYPPGKAEKAKKPRPMNTALLPPCRICGDKASGIHYGAVTCDACKGFFLRSLARSKDYLCSQNETCNIYGRDKTQVKCPKCRYDRVVQLKMSKDSIQSGRYSLEKRTKYILEVKGESWDTLDLSKVSDSNQNRTMQEFHRPIDHADEKRTNNFTNASGVFSSTSHFHPAIRSGSDEPLLSTSDDLFSRKETSMYTLAPPTSLPDANAFNLSASSDSDWPHNKAETTVNTTLISGSILPYNTSTEPSPSYTGRSSFAMTIPTSSADGGKCYYSAAARPPHTPTNLCATPTTNGSLPLVLGTTDTMLPRQETKTSALDLTTSQIPAETPESMTISQPLQHPVHRLKSSSRPLVFEQDASSLHEEDLQQVVSNILQAYYKFSNNTPENIAAMTAKVNDYLAKRVALFGDADGSGPGEAAPPTLVPDESQRQEMMSSMNEKVDMLAKQMIGIGKAIPNFKTLSPADQSSVIKNCFQCGAFLLMNLQMYDPDLGVFFAPDGNIYEQTHLYSFFDKEFIDKFYTLIKYIRRMSITDEELAMSIAVCMSMLDQFVLEEPQKAEHMLDICVHSLQDLVRRQHPDEPQRFAKLTHIFIELRSLDDMRLADSKIQDMTQTQLNPLWNELLDTDC